MSLRKIENVPSQQRASKKNSLVAKATSGARLQREQQQQQERISFSSPPTPTTTTASAASATAATTALPHVLKMPTFEPKQDKDSSEHDDSDDDDDSSSDEKDKEQEQKNQQSEQGGEEGSEAKSQDEFLSMKLDLQPHATQVEKCVVEGVGEVEVVTLPFNDYSIPVEDPWLDYGTPLVRYRNLWYKDNGGMYSGINRITYFFGIIDILMLYTPRKSVERAYKSIRYHGQGEVSSCPPGRYAVRFLSFINANTH